MMAVKALMGTKTLSRIGVNDDTICKELLSNARPFDPRAHAAMLKGKSLHQGKV